MIELNWNWKICECILLRCQKKRILKKKYFDKFEKIVRYLLTLNKSFEMNIRKFRKWKIKTFKYKIQNRHFFVAISKILFCVMSLIISKNETKFWKIFITKLNIEIKKTFIVALLIDIDEVICMNSYAIMWKIANVVNFEILRMKKNFAFDLRFLFLKKNRR